MVSGFQIKGVFVLRDIFSSRFFGVNMLFLLALSLLSSCVCVCVCVCNSVIVTVQARR